MAEVIKEELCLRHVWCFFLPNFGDPCIRVFGDNNGTIQMVVSPVTTSTSKHIDIRHHFLRELVEAGEVEITYVKPECQHADFLTRPLAKDAFQFHRNLFMNIS